METADVVRTYVEAFGRGDVDAVREVFDPVGTYTDPGTAQPVPGSRIGQHFAAFFAAFPDATTETVGLDPISAEVWVWRWIVRATHAGDFRGLPPTGRCLTLPGCEFIKVRAGKIQRIEGYYDRLSLLEQVGALPGSAAPAAS